MGTVDENDQGPWVWSGDDQAFAHGFVISRDGVTYLQSPRLADDKQSVADMLVAARQGQTAWMAHYSSTWGDMHTWLQARTSAQRTKLYQLCRGWDDIGDLR